MRTVTLALAATLGCGCATLAPAPAGGPAPVLHALDAALLYQALAEVPTPPELAAAYGEVCGEVDAAARRQALEAARGKLEQARREAAGTPRWTIPLRQRVGGYDLKRGGFEVNVRTGGAIRFDKFDFCQQPFAFLVAFANGDAFDFIPVADEQARQFVRTNGDRDVEVRLEVEPLRAQAGTPPVLVVRVVRATLKDALGGAVLGRSDGR
jgi:hypothetical protein